MKSFYNSDRAIEIDVLGIEFETGLLPVIWQEARSEGVDLAVKRIPREVFDRRWISKKPIVFYDLACAEIRPHVRDSKVAIELTYFSFSASSRSACRVRESQNLQENRSPYNWLDWIDYWSVDFDFGLDADSDRISHNASERQAFDIPISKHPILKQPVFKSQWQSFRTKQERHLDRRSPFYEMLPGCRKIAVKIVDILGNETIAIAKVTIAESRAKATKKK